FAQHVAVITGDDNNGVVEQVELVKLGPDSSDVVVDIADGRVIGAARIADFLDARITLIKPAHSAQTMAVWVLLDTRDIWVQWIRNVVALKAIPVFFGWLVRVVWVDEAGDHQEWHVFTGCLVDANPIVEVS